MRRLLFAAVAASSALLVLAMLALAAGRSPAELAAVMLRGSVGSRFAMEATIVKSIPLLLTGLAVALAVRGGVWNIGAEGQFIAGGLAAYICAPAGLVTGLVAAAVAGAAWAAIAAALKVWRNTPEVLSTILLNFVAIHLLGWCVNGPLQEARGRYPQSETTLALPLVAATGVHFGIIIALVAAVGCWLFLYRTGAGLRLRATGFNPAAAETAGIHVRSQTARALAVSGALAGLAGAIELFGVTHRLFERFAAGYGYSGIAVALLAQLHPLAAIVSAAFFGALATGAGELQRSAGVPSSVATLAQALVILALIVTGRSRAE